MAKRIVGLIGKGTGPKVHVGGPASVEVLGADEGHSVRVSMFSRDGFCYDPFHLTGGRTEIHCHFVQFSYEGPGKSLICNVHMET